MDVREKLVEMLNEAYFDYRHWKGEGDMIPNFASFLAAHGVTVKEWISASEPPEERGCYLVSVKHWLDGKPVTIEAFWNGADWLSCYWGKGDRVELTPRVTHWQYLPQPPKGE